MIIILLVQNGAALARLHRAGFFGNSLGQHTRPAATCCDRLTDSKATKSIRRHRRCGDITTAGPAAWWARVSLLMTYEVLAHDHRASWQLVGAAWAKHVLYPVLQNTLLRPRSHLAWPSGSAPGP